MHNSESILENEMHKLIWYFEIQTDHLISAKRPDVEIVNQKNPKKNLSNSALCRPNRPQNKIKRKQKER